MIKDCLKIGVLTFHRCINYGSYWQARCLVEGLRSLGHNAEILDHDSRKINLAEWKCAYRPVLPAAVPESDYPLYRKKVLKFFQAFDTLPLSKRFHITNPDEMDSYDVVVVGSDEVWNLFHPWYGNYQLFYGDGVRAQRLISYAASFGNYPAAWGLSESWTNRLRNFESISIRDLNSQLMIKNALGFEPEMVLDPCIQFPIEPDEAENNYAGTSYVAVYGHNFSETFSNHICKWARKRNLRLISIGYRNGWADEQWITAGPHEFATFIANATVVATNFFHGCIFALKNEKPFVSESSTYRSNKLEGLMMKVGAEKHLVTQDASFAGYNKCLSEELNVEILQKIDSLRSTSNEFINRALGFNQLQVA